jgi:hypothetical protein
MAASNGKGALPEGFVSPFKRVPQEDRFDDALACVAILTGKSLAEVRKLAEQLGLPKTGPYWVDENMFAKLLINLGGLVASKYKEVTSVDALPYVAILLVDYDENTEVGRHVVWHHVKGTKEQPAFHYVIDPSLHVGAHQQVTTDLSHLQPAWYIEVTPAKNGGARK